MQVEFEEKILQLEKVLAGLNKQFQWPMLVRKYDCDQPPRNV